ncbi:hypothetical protein H1R20_g7983, partial [Candolleomyces eurysporus]
MNTENLVLFWQSQLPNFSNCYPVTRVSDGMSDPLKPSNSLILTLLQVPDYREHPNIQEQVQGGVNVMIAQDNHLGLLHNYVHRFNLNNCLPKPLQDNLQSLIANGVATCSGQVSPGYPAEPTDLLMFPKNAPPSSLIPGLLREKLFATAGVPSPLNALYIFSCCVSQTTDLTSPTLFQASTWSPALGHSSHFSHATSEGADPSKSAIVQEAICILQHSDSNVFRSDDTDTFFQLATLKAALACQDAELCAHLKKSVKEWKEERDKERTSKAQAAPAKLSEDSSKASTSKSSTKGKETVPKTKTQSAKEVVVPEVKKKPKTRAASQSEGSKSKGKHCATPKSKETVSKEEQVKEGETVEQDEDVEMQEVDATREELEEDTSILVDQLDEEDEESN